MLECMNMSMRTATTSAGLTPALRQLKDCRHTIAAPTTATTTTDTARSSHRVAPKAEGCLTCKLAERVMREIDKEQRAAEVLKQREKATRELVWARSRRDALLMRHPTNWAGASLLQGPLPSYSQVRNLADNDEESRWGGAKGRSGRNRIKNNALARGRAGMGGAGVDSRPKLVPGVMLTLSSLGAEAILELTEEVHCEEHPGIRAENALGIVHEATAEVVFANRRDSLRTGVLIIKLQAIARGWLARRLARVLLLRGGCRREIDEAFGAWQYVWRYPSPSTAGAALDNAGGRGGNESRLSRRAGGGGGGGGGEAFFRSWYPPAMLKNEALPSPRAATRRVETEGKKREARLAFAKSLLADQKERLRKRDVRAERLLALAEVIKSVERATACLEGAAVDCFGTNKTSPGFSLRVLHPRGGGPEDGERDAAAAETLAAWRRMETKRREQVEAAALRTANENRNAGKSSRSNSPVRSGRGAERSQSSKFEIAGPERPQSSGRGDSRGRKKREKAVPVVVPTTNDNLADFEQRVLGASLHENASAAVASLLQRKRAVVAVRESSRLGRNKEAWARSGTSPFCIAIQSLPSWLCASRRFVVIAHRGRLVAVSQASPFVFWETLVTEESRSQVLREVLEPFLRNADLLKAMFAAGRVPPTTTLPEEPTAAAVNKSTTTDFKDYSATTTTTTATSPRVDGGGSDGGDRGQEGGREGAWSQPPAFTAAIVESENIGIGPPSGAHEEEPGSSPWGYLSSIAARGGWKVDAAEIARRDGSVELEFDSIAFDVFVRTDDRGSERRTATEGGDGATSSPPRKPTRTSSTNNRRARSSSHGDDDEDDDSASSVSRAIVTNAVPFRLVHGLPRELGPLLFDAKIDADVLAGKQIDRSSPQGKAESPPNKGTAESSSPNKGTAEPSSPKKGKTGSSSPKTDALEVNPNKEEEEEEEEEEGEGSGLGQGRGGCEIWKRKGDPLGNGEIFSHVLLRGRLDDDGRGAIEVRLRAGPLGVTELARAGLPKDVSALVVGVGSGDAGNGKGVGGGGGVGASGGKTGRAIRAH